MTLSFLQIYASGNGKGVSEKGEERGKERGEGRARKFTKKLTTKALNSFLFERVNQEELKRLKRV